MQDYKDLSGLQFIDFDFVTGCKQNQTLYSGGILSFLVVILSPISYFFAFFTDFSSYFQITKQTSGHNYENAIFQPGTVLLTLRVK